MENKQITLPTGSWNLLKSCLTCIGWANTYKDIYNVGKMEDEKTINLKPIDAATAPDQLKVWADTMEDFSISPALTSSIRKSLEFIVSKGELPANSYSSKLLEAFVEE